MSRSDAGRSGAGALVRHLAAQSRKVHPEGRPASVQAGDVPNRTVGGRPEGQLRHGRDQGRGHASGMDGGFDGKDYAVQGADYVLTNAYRRIDDRTL